MAVSLEQYNSDMSEIKQMLSNLVAQGQAMQGLSAQMQSLSTQVDDNMQKCERNFNDLGARLTALEGNGNSEGMDDGSGGDTGERRVRRRAEGGPAPSSSAGSVPVAPVPQVAPAMSYADAVKRASTAGVPQGNKLWLKGFERKLTRDVLDEQAKLYVKAVNEKCGTAFCPKVFAWNLELAAALVFDCKASADAFYRGCEGFTFTWTDMVGGEESNRRLRVVRDASFEQRARSQVYYHLRISLIALLKTKGMWTDELNVGNTGPRGVVFLHGKGEVWELFKVDPSKRGSGDFLSPVLENTRKFGISEKEIEELAAGVVSQASLLAKQR